MLGEKQPVPIRIYLGSIDQRIPETTKFVEELQLPRCVIACGPANRWFQRPTLSLPPKDPSWWLMAPCKAKKIFPAFLAIQPI